MKRLIILIVLLVVIFAVTSQSYAASMFDTGLTDDQMLEDIPTYYFLKDDIIWMNDAYSKYLGFRYNEYCDRMYMVHYRSGYTYYFQDYEGIGYDGCGALRRDIVYEQIKYMFQLEFAYD